MKRRFFLQNTAAVSASLALGSGFVFSPLAQAEGETNTTAAATDNSKDPFKLKSTDEVMSALDVKPETSTDIKIKAPEIAENGAVVPLTITSTIPKTTAISIIIANNPFPYVARFDLAENTTPEVATRVKMNKTSDVIALVTADGKTYMAKQEVKVTIGGCGG